MSSVSSEVDKADGTEVDVVTHCDELQVDKANRTEVEVVTHCDEIHFT
jgi:outer membrane protein OmpA-like peptidoglycan-associated protein